MTNLVPDKKRLLEPLAYHRELRDYLKSHEKPIWEWFANHRAAQDQRDAIRFDLLKTTYRLERPSQPTLYEAAELAAAELGLEVAVTIYQAQQSQSLNASIVPLANEAHIVLAGPVAERLSEPEMTALMAHELGHLLLYQIDDGDLLVVDQLLAALTNDRHAAPPHFHSARLFALYNEIFGDRAALAVLDDPLVVVATLVKMATGMKEVSAESYLRQAEEIFSRDNARTEGLTHPEAYIRARAVQLWAQGASDVDTAVSAMLEGPPTLDELDLLGQQRLMVLTRRLVDQILRPAWMRTDLILGHARLFFPDYQPPALENPDEALSHDLASAGDGLHQYFCYVLLDFITADRELGEHALAAGLALADRFGWNTQLIELAQKELRLRKKQVQQIDQQRENLLEAADKELRRKPADKEAKRK